MTKIAIFNQKGGVGKTTSSLNLAGAYHQHGNEVALIDLDPQAHLTFIYNAKLVNKEKSLFQFYQTEASLSSLFSPVQERLSLIAASAELVKVDSAYGRGPNILRKLGNGLATMKTEHPSLVTVMDCCPYIGVISLSAIFTCDVLIVPVASDYFSINSAVKVAKALQAVEPVLKRRVERRYLLTRADRRKKMTTEVELELRRIFGDEVLETKISENIALGESPQVGKNVFEYEPNSVGARDYMALYQELQALRYIHPAA